MPVRPELFLRDAANIPIPPTAITERIRHTWPDQKFDLRYLSASWALIRHWPDADPRWKWVKEEGYNPNFAWDNIGSLPINCSVEEAPAFLERMLRSDSRDDVQKLALKIADWNVFEHQEEVVKELIEDVRDAMGKQGEITSGIHPVTTAAPAINPTSANHAGSGYRKFIGEQMKLGKSMKEGAALWRERKAVPA